MLKATLLSALALVSSAALAQDKAADPWKCPWKQMKTHIPTPVSKDALKAYIVGKTIDSKLQIEIEPGLISFIYKEDGTCSYPRFYNAYEYDSSAVDRACKYTISDGGLLCAVFDDDGSKHCDKIVDTGRNYERVDPDDDFFRGTFRRSQDFTYGDFGCGSSG